MKIGDFSDIHLRATAPEMRIDKYYDKQLLKFAEALTVFNKEKVDIICQNGDWFDSPVLPYRVSRDCCNILSSNKIPIIGVAGQHDLRNHVWASFHNTPLGVLDANPMYHNLNESPFILGDVAFYGTNWDREIPEVTTGDLFNVLVIHKLITKSGPLYQGQESYTSGKMLLRKNPSFDLILSGDNHQQFVIEYKNKVNINPGSMMRLKSDQFDHEPAVFIFDTETRKTKRIALTIEPFEDVFDLEKINKNFDNKENGLLKAYIEGLQTEIDKPKFVPILMELIKLKKPRNGVIEAVNNNLP